MKKEIIYTIPSLYRDDFRVRGYRFGAGEKALCIAGSMRGNEYQQIYMASQAVAMLKEMEAADALAGGKEILVIPSLNPCSMNIEKRFWPTDNTDINRMFPGYALGETTQRIAAGVFQEISRYANGIQFASFYMPGQFCTHIRVMKTGYENLEKAKQFGLPYVVVKEPRPYDTTTLNYNWQIWETHAFSLYATVTDRIDENSAAQIWNGILRFMIRNGIAKKEKAEQFYKAVSGSAGEAAEHKGEDMVRIIGDQEFISVRPRKSGIFRSMTKVQEKVREGDILAKILDACEGECVEELIAPADGIVFFEHDRPLVYADTAVIKLLPC